MDWGIFGTGLWLGKRGGQWGNFSKGAHFFILGNWPWTGPGMTLRVPDHRVQ